MSTLKEIYEPPPLLFMEKDDEQATANALLIIEGGKWIGLDNKWKARSERSHHDSTVYHVHLRLRKNDIAVMNRDGSASHSSDTSLIPDYVKDMLRSKGLLENIIFELNENDARNLRVPIDLIDGVHNTIRKWQFSSRLMKRFSGRA